MRGKLQTAWPATPNFLGNGLPPPRRWWTLDKENSIWTSLSAATCVPTCGVCWAWLDPFETTNIYLLFQLTHTTCPLHALPVSFLICMGWHMAHARPSNRYTMVLVHMCFWAVTPRLEPAESGAWAGLKQGELRQPPPAWKSGVGGVPCTARRNFLNAAISPLPEPALALFVIGAFLSRDVVGRPSSLASPRREGWDDISAWSRGPVQQCGGGCGAVLASICTWERQT